MAPLRSALGALLMRTTTAAADPASPPRWPPLPPVRLLPLEAEPEPATNAAGGTRFRGAKTSAHGQGIAINVFAVVLAERHRVAVVRQADTREEAYLRAARRAACGWFTTVLGPGSDAAHADHLHLDALRHGTSGDYRICE